MNSLASLDGDNASLATQEASGTKSLGLTLIASRPDLARLVSPAQHRVLEFLLEGLTEPQIAGKLSRSRHTVHDHTKAIYQALGVNNRVQLVLLFSSPPRQSV
ncbi:MAG: response regulator transcription factor [Phycisphaerales bacterium]